LNLDLIKIFDDTVDFYNINTTGIPTEDIIIPYDNSIFFSVGSADDDANTRRYDITENIRSIIRTEISGHLTWVDDGTVYLRNVSDGNFYTYNINTSTSSLLANRPTNDFTTIWA